MPSAKSLPAMTRLTRRRRQSSRGAHLQLPSRLRRQGFETEKSKKCTRPAQKRSRPAANGRGGGAGSKTTPKSSSKATKNLQRLRNVDQYSVNAAVLENRSRSTSATQMRRRQYSRRQNFLAGA